MAGCCIAKGPSGNYVLNRGNGTEKSGPGPKKFILNLCIKTEPVTAKVDATVTVWLLFTYSISGTETGHKMLQLLR